MPRQSADTRSLPSMAHTMSNTSRRASRLVMTMTMTHSEKSNIRQMKAWPYRQECWGHDPAKKESVVLMKLALLASCAQTHCYGQCAVHQVLRWTQNKEKHEDNTQAVAGMNSQIRISESSDSEQHDESDREARRGTQRPGKPRKKKHPEEEVADTAVHGSLLIPSKFSFFGTRNSYSIASSL